MKKKNSFEIYEIFLTINKIMKILFDWVTGGPISISLPLAVFHIPFL